MRVGTERDGSDAYAVSLAGPEQVPLRMLVAVTSAREKTVGSTEGMERTEATSPYYRAWVDAAEDDLAVTVAYGQKDLGIDLGTVNTIVSE